MQTVGANTAMSLLLTATSNVLAVFTVPFVTARLLAMAGAVSFDPVAMMVRLVKAVLVPLAVGVLLRGLPQARSATPLLPILPLRPPRARCPGDSPASSR